MILYNSKNNNSSTYPLVEASFLNTFCNCHFDLIFFLTNIKELVINSYLYILRVDKSVQSGFDMKEIVTS